MDQLLIILIFKLALVIVLLSAITFMIMKIFFKNPFRSYFSARSTSSDRPKILPSKPEPVHDSLLELQQLDYVIENELRDIGVTGVVSGTEQKLDMLVRKLKGRTINPTNEKKDTEIQVVYKKDLSEEQFIEVLNRNQNYIPSHSQFLINVLKEKGLLNKLHDDSHSVFQIEGLLAGGPRKGSTLDNKELGEDTAGFCQIKDWMFCWVLDGESDSQPVMNIHNSIEFDTRKLVQDTGSKFIANIQRSNPTDKDIGRDFLYNLFSTTLQGVIKEWNSRLVRTQLKDYNAHTLTFGSTMILGCLNKNTKELHALRLGDSILLPFDQNYGLIAEAGILNERQRKAAFYAIFENNTFNVAKNLESQFQYACIKNVSLVYLISDGLIKKADDRSIFERAARQPNKTELLRKEVFDSDDKALVCIQITEG